MASELNAIRGRYARRELTSSPYQRSYDRAASASLDRDFLRWVQHVGWDDIERRSILEIGCGEGRKLERLIRMGFSPDRLIGNELLDDRLLLAKRNLPSTTKLYGGDATLLNLPAASFDVVMQCTVFSSILDRQFQEKLAGKMWQWAKAGGGVLWYDFVFDNPRNPDVAKVPLRRIQQLFPAGRVKAWKTTLAPPLARIVCRLHPSLHRVLTCLRPLRTHLLCWIEKR